MDPAAQHALSAAAVRMGGSVPAWFASDAYPLGALHVHAEGRVLAVVTIDATGKATACRVA